MNCKKNSIFCSFYFIYNNISMSSVNWNFKDNLTIPAEKYLKWIEFTGVSKSNILGMNSSSNVLLNSGNGDIYINCSTSNTSTTLINFNNSGNTLFNTKIGVGVSDTSNMMSNITLPKFGWIGINSTQGVHSGYLGLAGSSSLLTTTGSNIILYGVDATGGNSGKVKISSGSNTSGNIELYSGNNLSMQILNNGDTNFLPDGSNITVSINDTSTIVSSQLHISNTTQSHNGTSGAVTIAGGIGIDGNTYINGTLSINSVTGNINFNNSQISTSYSTGTVFFSGGLGIECSVSASSETSGGALSVAGGLALGKNAILGGNIKVLNSDVSTSSFTGSGIFYGGLGVNDRINIRSNNKSQIKLIPFTSTNETSIYFGNQNDYTTSGSWIIGHNLNTIGSTNFGIYNSDNDNFMILNSSSQIIYLQKYTSVLNTLNISNNTISNLITFNNTNSNLLWSIGRNVNESSGNFFISRYTQGNFINYLLTGETLTGNIRLYSTENSISVTSGGALSVNGGMSVTKNMIIGGTIDITSGSNLSSAKIQSFQFYSNYNNNGYSIIGSGSTSRGNASFLPIRFTGWEDQLNPKMVINTSTIDIPISLNATFNSNTLGTLFTTNGNIGINITSPAYELDLLGQMHIHNNYNSSLFIGSGNTSSNMRIYGPFTNGYGYIQCGATSTFGSMRIVQHNTTLGTMANFEVYSSRISLIGSNIGINTTNPGNYDLDVNGTLNVQTSITTSRLNTTHITATNIVASNTTFNSLFLTNLSVSNATITSLINSNLTTSNITSTTIITTNLTTNSLSSSNSRLTSITSTNINLTNLINTSAVITNASISSSTITNLYSTNTSTISNLYNTFITSENIYSPIGTISSILNSNQTNTNLVSTNVSAGTLNFITNMRSNTQTMNVSANTTSTRFAIVCASTSGAKINNLFQLYSFGGPGGATQGSLNIGSTTSNYFIVSSNSNSTYPLEPISLGFNSSYYLTLMSSGNIGINNTNPQYTLDVNGTLSVQTLITTSNISNLNTSVSNLVVTNGVRSIFNSNTIGNIYTTGGNVGINNKSPNQLLEINPITYSINQNGGFRIGTSNYISISDVSYRYIDIRLLSNNTNEYRGAIYGTLGGGISSEYEYMSFNENSSINIYSNVIFNNSQVSINSTSGSIRYLGGIAISNTSDASNITNGGALTVAGGGAFEKNVYIGGNLSVIGTIISNSPNTSFEYITITSSTNSINITTGALISYGGISIKASDNAISTTSGGGITCIGGISTSKDMYVGGTINSVMINSSNVNNINSTISNLIVSSGLTITNSTLNSVNSSTGALISYGGISINNTTNASSTTEGGSITISGGASILKDVYVGGTITSSSDIKLKTNLRSITGVLGKIDDIRTVKYNLKNGDTRDYIGFIAQDFEKDFKELLYRSNEESTYTLAYDRIPVILMQCIKELKQENIELRKWMDWIINKQK